MTTSSHTVLFTKSSCPPCAETKEFLTEVLADEPGLGKYISTLQKENHNALVTAYELNLFPVLLIVDSLGNELGLITGGKNVRADLRGVLLTLRYLDNQ